MKKLLISLLLICGVVLPSFSSAVNLPQSNWAWNRTDWDLFFIHSDTVSVSTNSQQYNVSVNDFVFVCVRREWSIWIQMSLDNSNWIEIWFSSQVCTTSESFYLKSNWSTSAIYWLYFTKDIPLFDGLKMSSLQCQTEYNLIPISSVDSNYCTTNNLCPSSDCPEYPDNPNLWTSNIYINDVFHPGAFNVIVNIPDEIDWDYAYTSSWSNFNLDVVGYNQDQEMIQWWIDTNNYKPTSEDFTNIFTNFSNFWWLLIGALFVILVFYFIKKLFR